MTAVSTCTARNTTASSERLRCRPSVTKRGSAPGSPAADGRDAERAHGGQQQQRDDAARAHQVPDRAGGQHADSRRRLARASRRCTRSCRRGARAARAGPPRSSQATAASPRTIAAVLAVLASTQVRGGHAHGPPDLGGRGAAARVDDVVHAPSRRRASGARSCSRWRGRRRPARSSGPRRVASLRWSSVTRIGQPPAGRWAGQRDVAAEIDERAGAGRRRARGARSGRRRAPSRSRRGRSRRPRGCAPCRRARSSRTRCQPAAGTMRMRGACPRRATTTREVASPSRARPASGRPSDRRRRPCAPRRRARRRAPRSSSGLVANGAAGRAVEQRRAPSRRGSGCRPRRCGAARPGRSSRAAGSAAGSATVTAALVPRAGKDAVAQVTLRAPGDGHRGLRWWRVRRAVGRRGLRRRPVSVSWWRESSVAESRASRRCRGRSGRGRSAAVCPAWLVAAAASTPNAGGRARRQCAGERRQRASRGAGSRLASRISGSRLPIRAFEQPNLRRHVRVLRGSGSS